MTQTARWSIGTAVAVALILAAGWFLLVDPQRSEAAELKEQTTATEADNSMLEVQIQTLKAQQKQLPKWQAQLAEIRSQIPVTPAMPSLIRSLSDVAKAAGVELTSLTPAPPVLNPGQLSAQELQLTVSGGYFEIQRFVNNLERMDRVMLVTGLGITEDLETDSEGNTSGALAGTVSGRVFLVPEGEPVAATSGTETTTTTTTTTGTQPASQ